MGGEGGSEHQRVMLEEGAALWGTARNLFISDADKRKSFCLQLKVFYESGRDVGTFASRPIKVRGV